MVMENTPVKDNAININPDAFSIEDNNRIMKIIQDPEDLEEWIVKIIDQEFWDLL